MRHVMVSNESRPRDWRKRTGWWRAWAWRILRLRWTVVRERHVGSIDADSELGRRCLLDDRSVVGDRRLWRKIEFLIALIVAV